MFRWTIRRFVETGTVLHMEGTIGLILGVKVLGTFGLFLLSALRTFFRVPEMFTVGH